MERAPDAHEGTSELDIRTRALEEPSVLVAKAERPELIEAPIGDTAIFEVELFVRRVLLGGGHCALPFQEGPLSYLL